MAGNFHNITRKHKFTGTFVYKELEYEYVLYLPDFSRSETKKERSETNKVIKEVITKFGNRMQKDADGNAKFCLDVNKKTIEGYIKFNQVSAYVIVNQVGSDETASGTLQIYNWCPEEDDSKPLVWINDVCRITVGEQAKLPVSPVGALFFVMEQLTVQNLEKKDIYLFVDKSEEADKIKLKYVYSTNYGFILNSEDHDLCQTHKAPDYLMVMKKPGLENNSEVLNFSFLTTSPIVTGGKKNKKKKTKRNRKIKRKHNHSKRHALKKSF